MKIFKFCNNWFQRWSSNCEERKRTYSFVEFGFRWSKNIDFVQTVCKSQQKRNFVGDKFHDQFTQLCVFGAWKKVNKFAKGFLSFSLLTTSGPLQPAWSNWWSSSSKAQCWTILWKSCPTIGLELGRVELCTRQYIYSRFKCSQSWNLLQYWSCFILGRLFEGLQLCFTIVQVKYCIVWLYWAVKELGWLGLV